MPDDTGHSLSALSNKTRAIVAGVIVCVASTNLAYFYSRGLINLYGDSMAHLEGARRFLDSRTPGYSEIGTVWLPIPHILMSLAAQNNFLWRTGLAGGIVSTLAFMLACWTIFKLSTRFNSSVQAGIVALAGFMLCPNMLYLASTPLTEPVAILFILLMVHELVRFQESGETRILIHAALAAFAGTLSRYECWSLLPFAAIFVMWAKQGNWQDRLRAGTIFSLIAGLGPILWVLHNAFRFENPFAFYDGPFSAKGIYAHQLATTAFRLPTDGSYLISLRYYLEDLRLVIGVWPLSLCLLGILAWAADRERRAARAVALILLVPFPFHIKSMATAAIPLYVPTLFPNTYWNLRLGSEMLAAAAIFPAFLLPLNAPAKLRNWVFGILLACFALQYAWTAHYGAAELAIAQEGVQNTPCRSQRQKALTSYLREHYDGGNVLLAAGKWMCAQPELGIPFRKTISDANTDSWKQAGDHPDKKVTWIVRGNDEPVDWLMRAHPESFTGFEEVFRQEVPGEGVVSVYRKKSY
jgi:hypothetical protein